MRAEMKAPNQLHVVEGGGLLAGGAVAALEQVAVDLFDTRPPLGVAIDIADHDFPRIRRADE